MKPKPIDATLLQAYQETHYKVFGNPEFTIKIAQKCEEVLDLYRVNKVNSCAFITAYNPFSRELSETENFERQRHLEGEIRHRSLKYLNGIGKHPDGLWPGEPSFLVFDISLEAAKAIGRNFEQNAIVWCGKDGIGQLELLI